MVAEVGGLPGLDAFSQMGGSAFGVTAHADVHDAFMTLPAYTRTSEGEVYELGLGVSNGSHSARSDPVLGKRESMERPCEATSAEGTARCASRRHWKTSLKGNVCNRQMVIFYTSQLGLLSRWSKRSNCKP